MKERIKVIGNQVVVDLENYKLIREDIFDWSRDKAEQIHTILPKPTCFAQSIRQDVKVGRKGFGSVQC